MRRLPLLVALLLVLGTPAETAFAKKGSEESPEPFRGFVVFKEGARNIAATEVRDAYTGRVISEELLHRGKPPKTHECRDPHSRSIGARWREFQPYYVNVTSLRPIEDGEGGWLDPAEVFTDIYDGFEAWEQPVATDCKVKRQSTYEAIYGGDTPLPGSLLNLTPDGHNVVEFRTLEGTICDGALACTIVYFERGRIYEADMVFEKDLTRYGFEDYWTTDETTFYDQGTDQYRFALIDVSTHESGHYLGLDHSKLSPELTMHPYIHDGAQTLGYGDLNGLTRLYH